MKKSNVYKLLGLTPPVTRAQVITAYRKLAMKFHPDKGGSATRFREITEAKNYILDNPGIEGVVTVEEEQDAEVFDDYLSKMFHEALGKTGAKVQPKQKASVEKIIRRMSRYDKSLTVQIFADEVVIQRRTPNGLWIISVDPHGSVIVQIDTINAYGNEKHLFRVHKYGDEARAVSDFFS